MKAKEKCCFLFHDYVDFDVFLNARIFYSLAGFQVVHENHISECSLVVFFRGMPAKVYSEYLGSLHFYDYVREYSIPIRDFFPKASSIAIISYENPSDCNFSYTYIYGYLPVIPRLWRFSLPFFGRSRIPIHLSNYKPIQSDDYQISLIVKIRKGMIKVYGAKWERVEILTHPCSYLSANLRLSKALVCYGLMYPYQRGKSLSGRMWQAPIQGCIVISEKNTNFIGSPGVIEVEDYENLPSIDFQCPDVLAFQAAEFWLNQTNSLAKSLNLTLNYNNLPTEVRLARLLLLINHIEFILNQSIIPTIQVITRFLRRSIRITITYIINLFS